MSGISIFVIDEQETQALAAALARECRAGDCLLLEGELGAGKTSFARGFIGALQKDQEEVISPSFMLAQTYPSHHGMLWHFDLYRLKSAEELRELGIEDALQSGITLVEWPERAPGFFPKQALNIRITYADDASSRHIEFSGDASWRSRLNSLKAKT